MLVVVEGVKLVLTFVCMVVAGSAIVVTGSRMMSITLGVHLGCCKMKLLKPERLAKEGFLSTVWSEAVRCRPE